MSLAARRIAVPLRQGYKRDRPWPIDVGSEGVNAGCAMLRVLGTSRRLCDGPSRRTFLLAGGLGGLGWSLPAPSHASLSRGDGPGFGRANRCVLLFLTGGPPQHDTWDPKPDAPAEVRGEFRPIATAAPGVYVSEVFPRLARRADKVCVLRSVTHGDSTHTSAGYTMLTGVTHPSANAASSSLIRPSPDDHPHVGSLLAKVRPPRGGVPVFASLPEVIKDNRVNVYPGQDAGFLGGRCAPYAIHADTRAGTFGPPDLLLPADVTADRLTDRRLLAGQLDRLSRAADRRPDLADSDAFRDQAFALLGDRSLARAFALDREPDRARDAYGPHLFGQGCLLARRLLEAGVALVTVYWHDEGPDDSPMWDTHWNNFRHLRERLAPPADRAVAALIEDLGARGLLADTLVVCTGEFGRTPRVNAKAGRDHWPGVQSVLLAGAGIRGGTVYGASDRHGAFPSEAPVAPADLTATVLHRLGVSPDFEVHDRGGRPLRACTGTPIRNLPA